MSETTTDVEAAGRAPSSGKPQGGWTTIAPRNSRFPLPDARELWQFREFAFTLAARELRLRYKQTALGVAWAVLQPIIATVLFSLLLGRVRGLPDDGVPYPPFVFSGLIVWWYFSTAVGAAAQSLVEDRSLVTKIYFPRILAPFAALLPGLVDFVLSLAVAAVILAIYAVSPGAAVLLVPVWLGLTVFSAAGFGVWLSAINVRYRDVRYALGFVFQVWFFATPVVFASSIVHGGWRYVFALNPLVGVIDAMRWSLVRGPAPGLPFAVSVVVAAVLLATGLVYFGRVERRFADVI